jgi:hypothetical protein
MLAVLDQLLNQLFAEAAMIDGSIEPAIDKRRA